VADVNANIGVNIDTSNALAQLKSLQRQLSQFHTSVAKSSTAAATAQASLQKNLINSINATGAFTAELRTVKTTSEAFTNSLEKNKFSMREYFRYAGAATKTFGKTFQSEFDTIGKVAEDRVKKLQTQYIKLGRDTQGAMKAIAVIPNQLDLSNHSTQLQLTAQRQAIFNQLLKQGSTNLLNFGKNTQWAGRQLMVGFTLPLASLGMVASKAFMDMETAALKFKKVYGDLLTPKAETQKALENVQELAKEFTKYGIAVSQTVSLAAEAAAAGFQGLDLQRQTIQATRLSILGQLDTQKALDTTIALQNAFKMSSEDLADSINFLNAVENQTVVSLDDITTAIPKVAPVIQQLGGDVKDLAFFMTAMKQGGINASEGANALKSGLASLINPTNTASKMLASMGINIKSIVESNQGDLKSTVIDFALALDKLDPLNRARAIEQMFGKFQFARLSALFSNVIAEGTQASRVLDLAGASIEDLASLSESELAMTAGSSMNKFRKAVEDLKVALVPVGEAFLQAVTPILEFFGNILEKFGSLSDNTKKIITVLTIAIGGIGPVALMAFGLLANGLANIIKLFATLRNGYLRLTGQSVVLGEQTQYMTMEQLEASAAAHSLNQSHANLIQTFTAESGAVRSLIAAYTDATVAASKFALANPAMMLPGRGKVAGKFAKGKPYVVGGSGTRDSEPAMLAPGETVIPAKMSKRYGKLINGMIAGNIPGYNAGKRSLTEDDSSFIASMRSVARPGSEANVEAFLRKELERMPETIVAEFKSLVSTISQEIKLSESALKPKLKELRSQYLSQMNQQNELQFSHIGEGRKITAGNLNASGAIAGDAKTQERLDYFIEKVGPDVVLDVKNGFAADITGFLNDAMGGSGASLETVIEDSIVSGTDKWRKSIEIGGGTFENLGEDLERFDSRFNQNLQAAYDRGGRIIVDTQAQVEKLRLSAIAKGKTFDDRIYVTLDALTDETLQNVGVLRQGLDRVFEEARQTITEPRYNSLTDEQAAALGPKFMGRASKDGRITPGGTGSRRRFRGAGDFRNIPENLFYNEGAQDARGYTSQVEANTQDIYVTSRDRTSPHELAPKDGRDDAIAYDKAREEALAKKRKRRVSQRKQGAAPIGPEAPAGATILPIVPQPTERDRRRSARRDARSNAFKSVKGKVAKNFGGGRGMAVSSSLMMGSQFLPGKAGNIATQVSGIAFVAQSLMMLPGPLKLFGAGLIASIGVYKIFSSAIEKARVKIEGLGDVANISKEKLSTLGSIFGVTPRELPSNSFRPGSKILPIGDKQRSAVSQVRANEEFQKQFKNDISSLRSATDAEATMVFKALAIQLKGRGFASEQIKTIIQALQEEAGKTDLKLNFKDIGVASVEAITQQVKLISIRIARSVAKALPPELRRVKVGIDSTKILPIKTEEIDSAVSSLKAILEGLILQFNAGEISALDFEAGLDAIRLGILRLPKDESIAAIEALLRKMPRSTQKAVDGIDDFNTKLKTALYITAGLVAADDPLIAVLRKVKDGKVIKEIMDEFERRKKQFISLIEGENDTTGGSVGGTTTAVGELSEASKKYIDVLEQELNALKKKRDANKEANDEMQRQIDLQLKQQDLTNQMKQAQISGDYLGAAFLGQQKRKNTLEFNQQTSENTMDAAIKRIEERLAELKDGKPLKPQEVKKMKKANGGYINSFMGGGNVSGKGTGKSDSIPAMLSNGEYVIQADSVNKYGQALFDSLNAQKFANGGRVKGYAQGGMPNVTGMGLDWLGKTLFKSGNSVIKNLLGFDATTPMNKKSGMEKLSMASMLIPGSSAAKTGMKAAKLADPEVMKYFLKRGSDGDILGIDDIIAVRGSGNDKVIDAFTQLVHDPIEGSQLFNIGNAGSIKTTRDLLAISLMRGANVSGINKAGIGFGASPDRSIYAEQLVETLRKKGLGKVLNLPAREASSVGSTKAEADSWMFQALNKLNNKKDIFEGSVEIPGAALDTARSALSGLLKSGYDKKIFAEYLKTFNQQTGMKKGFAMGGLVNLPKFHDWNGPVPGTYGQELPAMLKSGTEGIYQEGYINDLQQAAANTTNSANSVYNVSMTIDGGNSSPKEIAQEVMKQMQVLTNKNNKTNVGLR
jgi:TP901 family phage tail tape measure protein